MIKKKYIAYILSAAVGVSSAWAAGNDATAANSALEGGNVQGSASAIDLNDPAYQGREFLKKNAKKAGVVTLKSGLQYRVIQAGSGPRPGAHDVITANYEGRHLDQTVFDSSYSRKQPITFKLSEVIPGWQEALLLMRKGAVWMVYVPTDLAYGDLGAGSVIKRNETLIFKIQLVDFKRT